MKGVQFEEDDDLIKTPEPVYNLKKGFSKRKSLKIKISRSDAQSIVIFAILSVLLFTMSGLIFYRVKQNDPTKGETINPDTLTEIELYKLPEKIRSHLQQVKRYENRI